MATRREQIVAELQRLGRVAMTIHLRYEAYFSLHRAACVNEDRQEIEERRGQLHDTLDTLLDNGEAIQLLTNESERIP